MIKSLKKYQVQLTPFEATKNWTLNNINNDNLLLTEDDYPIALEFIDYSSGYPVDNTSCDIALEQQGTDLATIEEGLKVTGPFYPNIDPSNVDGTYKRTIYYQIRTMFYNTYFNPTKMWGLENIDFELSKTKRLLTDQFRLFDIPRIVFGDKMTPKSIVMSDNTLDNIYTITDDGNGNLFAGMNLFSHQQELGEYRNEFISNISSNLCDSYFGINIVYYSCFDTSSINTGLLSGSLIDSILYVSGFDSSSINTGLFTGSLNETILYRSGSDSSSINIGLHFGSLSSNSPFTDGINNAGINLGILTGSIETVIFTVSGSNESGSSDTAFYSGSLITIINVISGSNESGSSDTAFYSGSLITVIFTVSGSNESGSSDTAFYSGSLITTVIVAPNQSESGSINIGLFGGSLV